MHVDTAAPSDYYKRRYKCSISESGSTSVQQLRLMMCVCVDIDHLTSGGVALCTVATLEFPPLSVLTAHRDDIALSVQRTVVNSC